MNAEVFAKGFETCRLLTNLVENVENLDDFKCPKMQDLVKTNSFMDLLYLPFPTQNKASLCREESKSV